MREPRAGARAWTPFAWYAGLTLYFTFPLLASGARLGVSDWDPILLFHASVLKSAVEYAQLPFWNPWYCGGNVLWQNPQVALLTPVYPLALVAPLAVAMKLTIVLHYLAGFLGMHVLLTRTLGLSFLPAVVFVASLFALAGAPAFHLIAGHAPFLPYFYLPWILHGFVSAVETGRMRPVVWAAALVALTIYAGGTYLAFMTGVGLAGLAVAAAALRRRWQPIGLLAALGALAGLLAAPKLLPMLAFVRDPRLIDVRFFPPSPDRLTLQMLQAAFLDPAQYPRMRLGGQLYGWHEYGNYLGWLGVPLILAGVIWIAVERPWRAGDWIGTSLALTATALFLLMLGDLGPYSPYMLLRRLPFTADFRLPSRYTLVFLPCAAAMVGWILARLEGAGPGAPALRRLAAILFVLGTASLAYFNRVHLPGTFTQPPLASSLGFLSRPGAPALDTATDAWSAPGSPMLRAMMDGNRAVLNCNEPLQLRGSVLADRPIVFADGDVQVSGIEFTPNRVAFGAVSRGEGRVFLNQRPAPGWRSSLGPLAIDAQQDLAFVRVPAGTAQRVEFSFTPPWLGTGLALGALGLLAAAAARNLVV